MNIKPLFFAFVFSCFVCPNLPAEQLPLDVRDGSRLPFDVRSGSCDNSIFYMVDRNNGWARGTNAILKTTDGGATWGKVLPADPREPIGAFFYDRKTAWAVVGVTDDATNATVFHTTDAGHSWSSAEVRESIPIMSCFLSFPNKNSGWMMLIPDHGMNSMPGELFRTDDAGKTWRHINSVQLFDNFERLTDADLERAQPYLSCGGPILFRDAKNGWLVGAFTTTTPGYLFATHDGGDHWQGQTLPLPPSLRHGRMAPVGLPSFSRANGSAGTIEAEFVPDSAGLMDSSSVTYNTHNGGRTWHRGAASPAAEKARGESNQWLGRVIRITQIQFVDEKHGWAVALGNDLSGKLFRTEDGGKVWIAIQPTVQ